MTLIESYDRSPLQNIVGCLSMKPERLILVGPKAEVEKCAPLYQALLKGKGMQTIVCPLPLEAQTVDQAAAVFEPLAKKNSPCAFDLFGGDEVLLAAAGMVYQKLKGEYDISLQQIELQSGVLVDADGDGLVCQGAAAQLSVQETIELNGGLIIGEKSDVAEGHSASELDALWSMMKKDPNRWNKTVSVLNEFEKRATHGRATAEFELDLGVAVSGMNNATDKKKIYLDLLEKLYLRGALSYLKAQGNRLQYRYKDPLVRRCVKTAGNLLEYKTLLEAREYAPQGKPFFNDSRLGVTMDWDGVIHWEHSEMDTRNEIDVIAMRGVVPLFISCKNGMVDEEELYKLHTVAATLGGEFAKKMLIMTDFEGEHTASGRAFIQRAEDMGIFLEPHAARLDQAGWQQLFERVFA